LAAGDGGGTFGITFSLAGLDAGGFPGMGMTWPSCPVGAAACIIVKVLSAQSFTSFA